MSVIVEALKDGSVDGMPFKAGDHIEMMADTARKLSTLSPDPMVKVLGPSEQVANNVSGVTPVKLKRGPYADIQKKNVESASKGTVPPAGAYSGPKSPTGTAGMATRAAQVATDQK